MKQLTNRLFHFASLLLFLSPFSSMAQINAYASVTAISGVTLSLSNLNQTYHTFNNGDQIIIMQMQDNVAGANTTNTSSFGAVSTIANAGNYEVATIASVAGLPGSLTLTGAPTGTYTIGASSSVQIISFRKYGSPNYTTTAAITALPWNGKIGGVVAMQVPGTLTLAYSISADGAGFRGGAVSSNYEVGCEPSVYASNSTNYASKGEGIQVNATGLPYGRARMASGGGGGSDDNGGGAGGSNYSAGGAGGFGWTCSATPSGGIGGDALGTYLSKNRVFMGGGGGGGQQNNSVGSAGSNGGGIILLKANVLTTSCTGSLSISASGGNAVNSGNDGSGGAGAGGSVVMSFNSFTVPAGCPLTVTGNGGNGGNVTDPGAHGGGGGGGQGAILYPTTVPTTNITNTTNNGIGGNNNSSASSTAGSGSGPNGGGVLPNNGSILLPVTMSGFTGRIVGTGVLLNWNTLAEQGNDRYNVERSIDGIQYTPIGTVNGAGNSNTLKAYSFTDPAPNPGRNFYRLEQVDLDGAASFTSVVTVTIEQGGATNSLSVYPNPVRDQFTIRLSTNSDESYSLALIDMAGKTVLTRQGLSAGGQIHVGIDQKLTPGVYLLRLSGQQQVLFSKIFIQ